MTRCRTVTGRRRPGPATLLVALTMAAVIGSLDRPTVIAQVPAVDEQPLIDRAREFYLTAAYEDALDALADATSPAGRMYRSLCLMALGRTAEARTEVETLVRAAPDYLVPESELPPKFVTFFSETRAEALAALVRERFTAARTAYDAEAWQEALGGFEAVQALLADPAVAGGPAAAEFAVLAEAFIDLSRDALAAVEAERAAAEAEAARLEAERVAAEEAARRQPVITHPVAQYQPFPRWPGQTDPPEDAVGRIRITVDTDGRVTAAAMEVPIDRRYDMLLVNAAYSWLYSPATIDGRPVVVEHTVEVRVTQ